MHLFGGIRNFSVPAAGLFSRSRLRGTQGGRLYTTAQVWVPTGPRGACSGRSKSRNLASNRGVAFRPAIANQAACPKKVCFFFSFHFFRPTISLWRKKTKNKTGFPFFVQKPASSTVGSDESFLDTAYTRKKRVFRTQHFTAATSRRLTGHRS